MKRGSLYAPMRMSLRRKSSRTRRNERVVDQKRVLAPLPYTSSSSASVGIVSRAQEMAQRRTDQFQRTSSQRELERARLSFASLFRTDASEMTSTARAPSRTASTRSASRANSTRPTTTNSDQNEWIIAILEGRGAGNIVGLAAFDTTTHKIVLNQVSNPRPPSYAGR